MPPVRVQHMEAGKRQLDPKHILYVSKGFMELGNLLRIHLRMLKAHAKISSQSWCEDLRQI